MDIVENQGNGFGLEAAGIIRRTGTNVADLQVGDRVMILSSNCVSTSVIVSEYVCERIPSGLSFEDAATMPCVFATAVHSILDVANLRKGQVSSRISTQLEWAIADAFPSRSSSIVHVVASALQRSSWHR